jgi:hypothetical protein
MRRWSGASAADDEHAGPKVYVTSDPERLRELARMHRHAEYIARWREAEKRRRSGSVGKRAKVKWREEPPGHLSRSSRSVPGTKVWITKTAAILGRGRALDAERVEIERRRGEVAVAAMRQQELYQGLSAALATLNAIAILTAVSVP